MSSVLGWVLVFALDGGVQLTAEDREVIENLELLQDLDSAADLELLEELAVER
ncbi:MAG: hypothetical protein Q8N23_24385 [Archangium sp.]|nr:hypothetical protein [Archangium sp.]MDP3574206.1 hypothetical protein [Archangium sp.]